MRNLEEQGGSWMNDKKEQRINQGKKLRNLEEQGGSWMNDKDEHRIRRNKEKN